MTDTGQIPDEGQPAHAGAQPEQQPGAPVAPVAYSFADSGESTLGAPAEEEDLLMPGAQGAWSDAQMAAAQQRGQDGQRAQGTHGTHVTDGRDSGAIDYSAVRAAQPHTTEQGAGTGPGDGERVDGGAEAGTPGQPQPQIPVQASGQAKVPAQAQAQAQAQAEAPRRPLHLGPPVPEQSGAVRSLADRGPSSPAPTPAPAPVSASGTPGPAPQPQAQPQPVAVPAPLPEPVPAPEPEPVAQAEPATSGPEYLDVTHQGPDALAGPQLNGVPSGQDAWTSQLPQTASAETVEPEAAVPASGAPLPGPDPAGPDLAGPDLPGPDLAAVPEPAAPAEVSALPDAGQEPVPPDGVTAPSPAPEAASSGTSEEATGSADLPVPPTEEPVPATPVAVPATEAPEAEPEPAAEAEPTPEPEAEPLPAATAVAAPADGSAPTASATDQSASTHVAAPAADPLPEAAPAPVPAAPEAADVPEAAPVPDPAPVPQAVPAPGPVPAEHSPAPSISEDGPAAEAAPSTGGGPSDTPAPTPPAPTPPPAAPAPAPPPAPGYDEAEREAVHRLMRERRDIRNGFRSDPIPHEVLLRVLEAAHTAPSVGHSQPWDFVVIRSEDTRQAMHELAQRQREAYAKSLPKARAKQFKELKIEAILETPVNIVVTADPTRGGRHTLGRHSQPQMAPYSSALAVENLWLAARAEGLGVGWVSFFDERELVRTLDLPEHLEVVAYLCIGYVDEFPDEPELMQAGWSKRRPLSWVVHEESYGRRVLPGAEPHDLLAETLERIRPLDAKALGEAWERQKRMTKPAGALGMLEIISAQLCGLSRQCPPPIPEPAAVAVFAGDHGVHAQGVTPWPQEVTAQMVANFLGGGAVCNAFAAQVGAEVCVVDVGVSSELPATPGLLPRKVRPGTADMTQGPALTRDEVLRAVEVGIETARDLVASGNKALLTGEMGIANTTVSAALIAACTGADPAEVTGRGTGISDETHARKVDVVRRALQLHRPDPADPVGLLATVGGLEHAALTGLILGGASLRTPVILDGVSAGAAALVARQIAPEALAACISGHRSAEPGHVAALTKLGLRPLIDLDLRLGEGTGALLALPMVQSAARAMHEVATFDSAGVTEKN